MIQFTDDEAYQNYILPGVSRTFALTIPQLPSSLSKVVSNGYLLCRIADTIEDEPNLTPAQKSQFSQQFTQVVSGEFDPNLLSRTLYPLLSANTLATEKELIFNLNRIIRLTHSFTVSQHKALYQCVKVMAKGMTEFQQSLNGLKNMTEMDCYCYYVAGVVGEMLTQLFCDYSPQIARHKDLLQRLAISFGQALQMTNILKDIWEDQQRGVCWLPQDIFTQFDLKNLTPGYYDPAFGDGLIKLISIANQHVHNALRYILLIPASETGIRRFCLWALGMAILTLRRIFKHKDFSQGQQVKISRFNVKTTILISNIVTKSDVSLRILGYLLTRKLPSIS
jgi:farnesyl-diphosphate farnesyltransferase